MSTYVLCKIRGKNQYDLKVFSSSQGLSNWFYSSDFKNYSRFLFFDKPNFVICNPIRKKGDK